MMSDARKSGNSGLLEGRRVAIVGRLASMPKRQAGQMLRQHGAVAVEKPGLPIDLVVVGEAGLPLAEGASLDDWLDGMLADPATRQAVEDGALEVISESQLWQRLGMIEDEQQIHRLYTPAMLAELLKVPVAVIRRWHRRGLIVPARQVHKLPYFDFREVATARRLAELLAAGMSPRTIEKKLAALARYVPSAERPLAQLSVIIEGKQILLRQGNGLVEPGGQLRLDFDVAEQQEVGPAPEPVEVFAVAETTPGFNEEPATLGFPASAEQMERMAAELEEEGDLAGAAEMVRTLMAVRGPQAELCFELAELLYRMGELSAARERYFMAIELDEDYVEARANLGCVLAEMGQRHLAEAAFRGALVHYDGYADVHCHLARLLDESGRRQEAAEHWKTFLELAPDSPWAEEARHRLEEGS